MTYEEKLLNDMNNLKPNVYYRIDNRPDYERMVAVIKTFIDAYYPFLFSNDFKKVKREDATNH